MAIFTNVTWMRGAAKSSVARKSIGVLCAMAVASFSLGRLRADIFPTGCDKASGGQGNTSTTGVNFSNHQAHLGDTVQVFPTLGMVGPALPQTGGGCEALNSTGSVYIASGLLVKFLDNVDLLPANTPFQCPTNTSPPCAPGPYNVLITPALVGAGVTYPEGSIGGAVNTVRALQWSFSSHVRSNPTGYETLDKIDTASITIVHPCILVVKQCVLPQGRSCFNPGETVVFTGYVTNCGDISLTNVIANDTQTGRLVLNDPTTGLPLPTNSNGGITLTVGSVANYRASYVPTLVETCLGATTNSVTATGTDTSDIGGPNANVSSSTTTFCPICVVPGLVVTKACPAQPTPPGGTLVFSGTVTNTGNITLTNVTVVNNQPAPNTAVFGPVTLLPGAGASFTGSYTVPLDSCGPYSDTLTARGTTLCGGNITNTATAVCPGTNTPCIFVSKSCTGPIVVGQPQTISGVVSNCGNITLTNVVLTDNILGAITNISTLPVGASVSYSKTFTAGCVGNTNTVTATATSVCGTPVQQTATAPCFVTSTPCLQVTKQCTTNQLGAPQTVSGTVSNCGNITITNIIVSDNDDGIAGTIATISSLTPGQSTTYSVTYTATNCGPSSGIVTARGTSTCGQGVTNTATAPCLTICTPVIKVYKQVVCFSNVCEPFNLDLTTQKTATGVSAGTNCPAFCYRITVTNAGNEVLTGVTVVDNTMNLSSCGFPTTLPIGGSASCIIPAVTHCANTMNIVTATGTGATATGTTNVTSTDTNLVTVLPISVACNLLVSTDNGVTFVAPSVCATQQLGLSYIVRIVVTNTGSYALQNVTVSSVTGLGSCLGAGVNLGSLAVGASTTKDCTNTCTSVGRTDYAVSVNAQASQSSGHICAYNAQGVLITTSSQCNTCVVCVGIPVIKVYKQVVCYTNICEQFNSDLTTQKSALGVRVDGNCPAFCYRFTVTNLGNITLTNVTVVDNTLDLSVCFPAPFTLAPAGQPNSSAVCIITDVGHCANTMNIVTASGTGFTGSQSQNVTSTDTNNVTIVPISVICNLAVSTDNGATFTTPSVCATQLLNHSYIVAIGVTNNGQYALQNVTLTSTGTTPLCLTSLNLGSLAVGAGTVVYCTNNCVTPGTANYAASVVAEASQAAGHVCTYTTNGVKITASSACNTCVTCVGIPAIKVFKQVVCWTNLCETFNNDLTTQKSALGVRVDGNCPAFCYRFVVTNTGNITLTNVTVVDNTLDLSACLFPTTLPVGGSVSCIVSDVSHCANTMNIVTANGTGFTGSQSQNVTATDTNNVTIVPISVICNMLVSTDNGATFTTPSVCATQVLNHSYIVAVGVTNNGQYALQNVTLTPSAGLSSCITAPLNLGSLAVGAGTMVFCTNTCTVPGTTTYSATIAAEASQAAGHVCVYNTNGVKITASSSCNTCVTCQGLPKICVTKLIACYLGTNGVGADVCGTYGKSAIGVAGDTQNPAFCYSITVSNCGQVAMTNVTVIDDKYGDLTTDFFPTPGTVFPVGGTVSFHFKVELPPGPNSTIGFVTNTVTADGQSIIDGTHTNAIDSALAEIVPASVSCKLQYSIDGGPLTNNATLTDQNPHLVAWYITVFNTGLANLCDIKVTDEDHTLGCAVSILPFCLDAGANSGPLLMCTNASFVCTNFSTGISDTLMVTSDSFTYGPNHIPVCAHDLTGSTNTIGTNFDNIVVRSECVVTLHCQQPNACRVTGGGRQDSPIVYPDNVRYVTHGGQVGAPVGDRICVVLTNFYLGNPCIHGRWTHVRHMQGGLEGNFHARFYDTLDCACLDTNTTPVTVTVPGVDGAGAQTYVNLVYGPGTTVGNVCGNRNIGPLPRPAPANKIVFTGVGDWADPNGRRASRSVLFRVDIEDRGEPGNSHALGANGKPGRVPDRYRIRIWVLSDAELAELNGSGPDKWLLNFRNAISACNGINVQDGASLVNGSAAFGVRAPDVDDGGELERGNHQIHPMIKQCDPFAPDGPPLAKP